MKKRNAMLSVAVLMVGVWLIAYSATGPNPLNSLVVTILIFLPAAALLFKK
jgi:Co/Zn/Cd efflux system component